MSRSPRLASIVLCLFSGLTLLNGCNDDCTTGPETGGGTLILAPEPDIVDAPWILDGPADLYISGTGDASFTGLPAGTYSVTWGAVPGWDTPADDDGVLEVGATLMFNGDYELGQFAFVPAGSFRMGSPLSEEGHTDAEVQHDVTLSRGFHIARYEVTEALWSTVMGTGPTTSQLPQTDVTWDAAVAFCNALSTIDGLTPVYTINGTDGDVTWNRNADGYRLPTDAEWEYACRAGSTTALSNGPLVEAECGFDTNLDAVGWYCGNADFSRHAIGLKQPNAWGLYDMHGNMWEWCWDGYRQDAHNLPQLDPVVDGAPGAHRVVRSGTYWFYGEFCRSAFRGSYGPAATPGGLSLRLVRTAF